MQLQETILPILCAAGFILLYWYVPKGILKMLGLGNDGETKASEAAQR
jgi:hypothetical protein